MKSFADCDCPYHRFAHEQAAKDAPQKEAIAQPEIENLDQPKENNPEILGVG